MTSVCSELKSDIHAQIERSRNRIPVYPLFGVEAGERIDTEYKGGKTKRVKIGLNKKHLIAL